MARRQRPRAASYRLRSRRSREPSGSSSARRSGSTGRNPGRRSRSASRSRWSTRSCGRPRLEPDLRRRGAALLATLSYVVACSIVTGQPLRTRGAVVAYCSACSSSSRFHSSQRSSSFPASSGWRSSASRSRPRSSRVSACAALVPRGFGSPGSTSSTSRRLGHARDRRVPHPGIALLRPSRVRREHGSRRDARFDRRVAARVSRRRAPVRRPGRSVSSARATKGARCRPT